MFRKLCLIALPFLLLINSSCKKEIHTIAFYNLENLFDTLESGQFNDDEFLPYSEKKWDTRKYNTKLDSLAKVIAMIGDKDGPEILGLCEMENRRVLEDLRNRKKIKKYKYQIAHIESNDRRGIDVALFFKPVYSLDTVLALKVVIEEEAYFRTRDVLYIKLLDKNKKEFHFYVNHWPSRSGGEENSMYKRMAASNTLKSHLTDLLNKDAQANVIIVGDFNDEPTNESLQNLSGLVFNVFSKLDSAGKGSYRYRDNWNMLDQILISSSLNDGESPDYIKGSAGIFEKEWLKQKGIDNRYKGYPLRTWGGRYYLGGFSDHFPVYIQIQK